MPAIPMSVPSVRVSPSCGMCPVEGRPDREGVEARPPAPPSPRYEAELSGRKKAAASGSDGGGTPKPCCVEKPGVGVDRSARRGEGGQAGGKCRLPL